jgi:hypothetical protein
MLFYNDILFHKRLHLRIWAASMNAGKGALDRQPSFLLENLYSQRRSDNDHSERPPKQVRAPSLS